jgi:6,7-dimethyl-8-ribityllumazine synthase
MASSEDHGVLALPEFSPPPKLLLIAAPFYRAIADDLIAGAVATLGKVNAAHDLIEVPGALEIPTAIRLAKERYEGFVALGCVIRGETTHYETVCNDSSRGLTLLGLDGLCIGNGILTCESMEQARVRAAPSEMDKGGGAAAAALHLIALARRFRAPDRPDRALPGGEDDILLAERTGMTRTA